MSVSSILPRPSTAPHTSQTVPSSCPSCGYSLPSLSSPSDASRRIADLEAQVKLLNSKAAAAVDKLADYEDEVRYLRTAYAQSQQQRQSPNANAYGDVVSPAAQVQQQSRLSSLSSLLGRRRNPSSETNAIPTTPAPNNAFSPSHAHSPNISGQHNNYSTPNLPPPPISKDFPFEQGRSASASVAAGPTLLSLQSTLESERTLRMQAENNLAQSQNELEELTAQLFGQANEMVAEERRQRHKLEERVKILEERGKRKEERLDVLEKRVKRVERVRGMVGS